MKTLKLKNVLVERVSKAPGEKRTKNKRVIRLHPAEAEKMQKIIHKERVAMRRWAKWTDGLIETVPFAMLPDGSGRLVVRSTQNEQHRKLPPNWADESEGYRADIEILMQGYTSEKSQGIRCHLLNLKRREDGKTG